jgi:hypothetical protein
MDIVIKIAAVIGAVLMLGLCVSSFVVTDLAPED